MSWGRHETTSALDGQKQNNLSQKTENDDIIPLPHESCSDLSLPMTLRLRAGNVAATQGWYTVDESATGQL